MVVTPDGTLIAGESRIAACRLLGWREIPVTVIDLANVVRGEHDENTYRKGFTPSEAVAIGDALTPLEREAARERQATLNNGASEKVTEARGNALDRVAEAVGMSRPTFAKAQAVVKAAMRYPRQR